MNPTPMPIVSSATAEAAADSSFTLVSSSSSSDNNIRNFDLAATLLGDVLVAVSVTALAAPFLTVIDKALVQRSAASAATSHNSNTVVSVWSSMVQSGTYMCRHPVQFLRSPTYLWMWGTYAATYAAANTLRTLTTTTATTIAETEHSSSSSSSCTTSFAPPHSVSATATAASTTTTAAATCTKTTTTPHTTHTHTDTPPVSTTTAGAGGSGPNMTLFVGTAVVNSTASILKDRAYAKMYGATATTATTATAAFSVPRISYALWMMRDLTVIGAAFVLPSYVADALLLRQRQQQYNVSNNVDPDKARADATRAAQLLTPVAAQLIAGPLHYVGLDCCNRNLKLQSQQFPTAALRLAERLRFLRAGVGEVVLARMARILPGYGIAGVLNTELRAQWRTQLVLPMLSSMSLSSLRNNNNTRNNNILQQQQRRPLQHC